MLKAVRRFGGIVYGHIMHTEAELETWLTSKKENIEDMLKRRYFYRPAFEIYGGVSGLYDYGPPGCAIKRELEGLWRDHFILEEDMLEISGTNITPDIVLDASGHKEKFSDFMVKEEGTDKCYRADKLLKEALTAIKADAATTPEVKQECERLIILCDSMNAEQLHEHFQRFQVKAPNSDKGLTFPEPFNLMFSTMVGPSGKHQAFLRPETAQGIFVNFKNLYEFNRSRLPFAAAQIGIGFRNEISPRDGLLRVREFTMAEIEHFVHPDDKAHPKFQSIQDLPLPLFSRDLQTTGQQPEVLPVGEAVERRIIDNQTLAYFMARTYLFLRSCGIQDAGLRFRQHLDKEMAHYAKDCWDAEILTSYGWIECVGIADRSCFDLSRHSERSKKNLMAALRYDQPKKVEVIDMKPNKGVIGKTFRQKAQRVIAQLEELSEAEKAAHMEAVAAGQGVTITVDGEEVLLTPEMIKPAKVLQTVSQETFYPSVIEPSFGVGRILYAILEHSYRERSDLEEVRKYFWFPARLAPVKCCILPLSKNAEFDPAVARIKTLLKQKGLSVEVDDSSSTIGRRYARCDEIGIPFGVTVDFQSLQDNTVTLRESETMAQIRIGLDEVPRVLKHLVSGKVKWESVTQQYPLFQTESN